MDRLFRRSKNWGIVGGSRVIDGLRVDKVGEIISKVGLENPKERVFAIKPKV